MKHDDGSVWSFDYEDPDPNGGWLEVRKYAVGGVVISAMDADGRPITTVDADSFAEMCRSFLRFSNIDNS